MTDGASLGTTSPLATWESNWNYLTNLDFFPKLKDDIKIKTGFGGLVSIICGIFVFSLVVMEFYLYFRQDIISEVSVDNDFRQKLRVNVDFTFPALSCNGFGLDLVDSAGEQSLEVSENLIKKHTSRGSETRHELLGCRITGHLEVNKVRGEFHIAFGRKAISDAGQSQHGHAFSFLELLTFNSSHIINHLSFGEDFPGAIHPLDKMKKIVLEGSGRYLYYIQIVPTVYKYQSGRVVYTNQFSVTEKETMVDVTAHSFQQPGIYFKYEFTPYTVTYIERVRPFSHFITSICSIVGGVVVVSGMINSMGWYFERYLEKPVRMEEY